MLELFLFHFLGILSVVSIIGIVLFLKASSAHIKMSHVPLFIFLGIIDAVVSIAIVIYCSDYLFTHIQSFFINVTPAVLHMYTMSIVAVCVVFLLHRIMKLFYSDAMKVATITLIALFLIALVTLQPVAYAWSNLLVQLFLS